jgi:hypothetical protein
VGKAASGKWLGLRVEVWHMARIPKCLNNW